MLKCLSDTCTVKLYFDPEIYQQYSIGQKEIALHIWVLYGKMTIHYQKLRAF